MKICPNCKIKTDKKFCNKCDAENVEVRVCNAKNEDGSNCENVLEFDDKFCAECCYKVEGVEQTEREAPSTGGISNIEAKHEAEDRKSDGKSEAPSTGSISNIEAKHEAEDRKSDGKSGNADASSTGFSDIEVKHEEDDINSDGKSKNAEPTSKQTDAPAVEVNTTEGSVTDDYVEISDDEYVSPDESSTNETTYTQKEQRDDKTVSVGISAASTSSMDTNENIGIKETASAASQSTSFIEVQFQAILSPDIKFNINFDSVCICLRENDVPHRKLYKVNHNGKSNGCLIFGPYTHFLPRDTVMAGRISYKYYVDRQSKSDPHYENRSSFYEIVYGSSTTETKRVLRVSPKYEHSATWSQFDGFIYRPPKKGSYERFKNFVKKFWNKEDGAEKSVKIFGESIVRPLTVRPRPTIQNMRQTCAQLLYSLENIYQDSTEQIRLSLWAVFEQESTHRPAETEFQTETRLHVLVSMLFLQKDHVIVLNEACKFTVCNQFLLKGPWQNQRVREWKILEAMFPNDRSELRDAFLELSYSVQQEMKSAVWLYLVPYIHFLNDQSRPFERTPRNAGHGNEPPLWWGIQDKKLKQTVDNFKLKIGYGWPTTCTLQQLCLSIKDLFEVDYLLPRTTIAALHYTELKEAFDLHVFPVEVCCAALFYYLKTLEGAETDEYMQTSIEAVLKQIQSTPESGCENNRWLRSTISAQMLSESIRKNKHTRIVCLSAEIFTWCISVYDGSLTDDSEHTASEKSNNRESVKDACGKLIGWMKRQTMSVSQEIEVWNTLLGHISGPGDIIGSWNETLKSAVGESLQKRNERSDKYEMVSLYCKGGQTMKTEMQDILRRCIEATIQQAEDFDVSDWKESERENLLDLVANVFLSDWEQMALTSMGMNIDILLGWQSLPFYAKILNKDEAKCYLRPTHVNPLLHIENTLETTISCLLKGNISTHDLKCLSEHRDTFLSVVACFKCGRRDDIDAVLEIREYEYSQFRRQVDHLNFLHGLCGYLPQVDTKPIDEILQKAKAEHCELNSLLIVKHENELRDFSNTDKVQLASDNSALIRLLEKIDPYRDSQCFSLWWKEECDKLEVEKCRTLDDVNECVMSALERRIGQVSDDISSGSITFGTMEQLFGILYNSKYDSMREELLQICKDEKCIEKRIEQLKNYRNHQCMNEAAHVMMDLKQEYCLSGNFEPIKNILPQQEDVAFKDYDESLTLFGNSLVEQKQAKITCLRTFVKCHKLVKWLRESMSESGLRELIVFVDLATISAGESAEKMAMVKSLHTGATGYTSLIFDLKESDDYSQVIKKSKAVWKVLSEKPSLPDTLLFADQHLQWFKHVKETRGEVERTSFMEANTINKFGIFTIGTNAGKKLRKAGHIVETNTVSIELSDVIKLTIPADEEQRRIDVREYTLGELENLQSKLMLVAGEADKGTERSIEKVERFTMVLDGVIRLSQIYIKLVSSGCVLFKNFAIKLFCEPNLEQPVCVILDLKNGESLTQLKCRKTSEERLENIMPKVAAQMEKCLEDWINFVNKNRLEHHHLNYFTMDQLVIIQQDIATICIGKQPSPKLYSLLHIVKRNCNEDDVKRANDKAGQEIKAEDNKRDEQVFVETQEKENPKRDEFIRKLSLAKYDRLVPFAMEKFPNFEISKAITWCMRNKNKVEEFEAQRRSQISKTTNILDDLATGDTQPQYTIDTWMKKAFASEGQYDRCESMLHKFGGIWKEFVQAMISNLQDFISLKQLGVLLRHLANDDECPIKRTLSDCYDESSPNLVICDTDQILISTLSVYMMDEDLPLPQSDEVLMCSAKTTLEQVDVFLRRAIFFSNGKIHCIVNADLMDFLVCEGVYERLHEYTRKAEKPDVYRLIIICGSDKEHSLSMISSLEKYRKVPLILDHGRVKAQIDKKLKLSADEKKAAASVDFERSTVRLVQSSRSGVGKTLYKNKTEEKLKELTSSETFTGITLPLHRKNINIDNVIGRLLKYTEGPDFTEPRLFHIDVTNEVQEGVDYLLFNLLILGCLVHKSGHVWRKSSFDLYLIETMVKEITTDNKDMVPHYKHQMFHFLPTVTCRSPDESVKVYEKTLADYKTSDQIFDEALYESDLYKKPYICLLELEGKNRKSVSKTDCLKTLLRTCRVKDPSWSEMNHFVTFFYTQLIALENNLFVKSADLPGFGTFVKKFLIQMSKDFSSRSLNMSEETGEINTSPTASDVPEELKEYQMKRTWESSPHPYLFFNADHLTFTFIGFYIDRETGNVIDLQTGTILAEKIIRPNLYDLLKINGVPVTEDFDKLPRIEKIQRLCMVMGIQTPKEKLDPDKTYELTTDNVKKMMAIYMRFRCNIPVIIMGETGCGKTRLVKFLCDLMTSGTETKCGRKAQNMIIVKVHGGTTNREIISKVEESEKLAKENKDNFGENIYTVLFFDEANTTDSIGLLKEIMCDKTMDGKPLTLCNNLKLVAACNPYRRHPEILIQKLEKAGLGYHVRANETSDRLGRIPLRRLVYRVQPLPQSLHPFVWDFGQLTTSVERLYISQMVKRYMMEGQIKGDEQQVMVISDILTTSQEYMRTLKDECSFVSLRDVDRVLQIMAWFYNRTDDIFFQNADEKLQHVYAVKCVKTQVKKLSKVTRSLVLALGVCYHACLSDRGSYRKYIANAFREPCILTRGAEQIREEIECCQEAILDAVSLKSNIARNLALKENVFMMVVCIELRIPLFLVGKPGSSKSLARLIVSDAMQGSASTNELFKEMKQVQMLSFQCSPHSTPSGISTVFRQCAAFQKNNNLEKFVSVVVLDEVGLAEDSPTLPLKTLHPLLEDGCQGDEKPEPHKKVGFIGISNWALDPAKMNRGIFVQRSVPDSTELKETAIGICQDTSQFPEMEKLIDELSDGYLQVFLTATETKREFYGLRDFYCLLKMINQNVIDLRRLPSFHQLRFALRRNFSGLETVRSVSIFLDKIKAVPISDEANENDPDDSFKGLIDSCIDDTNSRHLLLLTENYSALTTFQQHFLARKTHLKTTTIFGSSFRRDQEYTQVCRNINRIKICMETGNTVILLNSDNLYESLYEALNQYYVNFGGQRYVDLGLGTHRVKSPVHPNFKLIVVAEKQTVYDEFPIPLINRLEKHFLTSKTMLTNFQVKTSLELKKWTNTITSQALKLSKSPTEKDVGKVIIGFHDDACPAVILDVWDQVNCIDENKKKHLVLMKAREVLLWCATPDAIVRIGDSVLTDKDEIQKVYWKMQKHQSITQYLRFKLITQKCERLLAQVTTHAKLLTAVHRTALKDATNIPESKILLLESLTTFDTEQQFNSKIRDFLRKAKDTPVLLIIQCDTGDENANLIACARHSALDECANERLRRMSPVHIVFILQLTTFSRRDFKSIQCGDWHSVHIDNLHSVVDTMPCIHEMKGKSVATLIEEATKEIQSQHDDANYAKIPETEPSSVTEPATNRPLDINMNDGLGRKCIDLKQILCMCVQRAMSMVRDTGEGGFRITNRISLLLNLLQHTDDFAKGIGILLARLLEDKDKSSVRSSVENWLPREAATVEIIQKAGTLRRACLQTFERKLSPILAGIIAVLDTNKNINILSKKETWKENLWVRMLNRSDIFEFKYRDNVPDSNEKPPVDFLVHGTGQEDNIFQSKMPFSWMLSKKMTEILKELDRGKIGDDDSRKKKVVAETSVMKLVSTVPEENYDDALDCYIHDFVNMMYSSKEHEIHIVCEMVKNEAKDITAEQESLSFALLNVHIAYNNLSKKLKYFREMNHVWQECSSSLLSINGLEEDHILRTLQCKDRVIEALYLLIENLYPREDPSQIFDVQSCRATWLVKVYKCRYVVQQTFTFYTLLGKTCTESETVLSEARSMWCRVVVMQLFVENVCKSSSEENITIELCCPLWMQLLEENIDMKSLKTIQTVEEFLTLCYSLAKDEYEEKIHRCSHCSRVLNETSRKLLPCEHEVCAICIQTMSRQPEDMHCPTCQETLDVKFFDIDSVESRFVLGKDKLADYRKRCTVFLMEIVSQLCFSDKKSPGSDVIEKLMNYSLESEITNTGVDSNHAFKTFIFRLLIRTSENEFRQHLENHLMQKEVKTSEEETSNEENKNVLINQEELLLIIAYCIEDNITEQAFSKKTVPVLKSLENAFELMYKPKSAVDQVEGIARARICLTKAATCLRNQVCDGTLSSKEDEDYLKMAESLCEKTTETGTWKFILKFLYHHYGFDALTAAIKSDISWIYRDELKSKDPDRIDRYIPCGEMYVQIKEYFAGPVGSRGAQELMEFLKTFRLPYEHACVYLQMAMFWETSLSKVKRNVDQVKHILASLKNSNIGFGNKSIIGVLASDELGTFHVDIDCDSNENEANIKSLVFQWISILLNAERLTRCRLLTTLILLAKEPQTFNKAFLPTMEQDDMFEFIELLKEEATDTQNVYRCKNGHPYVIKDCGRPWVKATCPCGASIGGQLHVLEETNVKDDGSDKTLTGHILGDPEERKTGPVIERDLKRINCACMRFLLHLTMYAACAGNKLEDVYKLIKHDIELSFTIEFLKRHIEKDIQDVQIVLNVNMDDGLLFCHHLLDSIVGKCSIETSDDECPTGNWSSKEERRKWENSFDNKYICPVVQDSSGIISSASDLIQKNNELVTLLSESKYEVSKGDDQEELLCKNPMFWMYRVPITFTHMKHTFQREYLTDTDSIKYPLLKRFMDEEHLLAAIRFIPSILKLQRHLLRKYSQRSYKGEIEKITVGTLKQEKIAGEETETLLQHVSEAWNITRKIIVSRKHVCLSEFGRVFVPKELCDEPITDGTSIVVLLPNTDDKGICSFAMLELLMKIQNEFLDEYLKISQSNGAEIRLSTVCPKEVTSAHLISFDSIRDIQPLVLANCSFHVRDTNIIYDFDNFEKQLVERFVSTKSKIKVTPFMEIDQMIYRTDFSVSDAMMMLESKIPQVRVTPVMRSQICGEVREIPDICQILSSLDIAIRVLNLTGGLQDSSLYEFMVETLQMNRGVLTTKMRQLCKLCHVKSLWITLSIQKAYIMVTHENNTKNIFEMIGEPNHEPVSEENLNQLSAFLTRQSGERLHNLLDVLFEYITLKVSRKQNEEDEEYVDESCYPLNQCIYCYADEIDREDQLKFVTWTDEGTSGYDFPKTNQRKHCLHTWVAVAKRIAQCKAV